MRMVLGHGRRLTLVGIAFGIAGALVVSRLMQQALFEVEPRSHWSTSHYQSPCCWSRRLRRSFRREARPGFTA